MKRGNMAKQPSVETQLRTARADLRRTQAELHRANLAANEYRIRATKAEQEAAEWKSRFDKLLDREPKETP